MTCSGFR